MADRATAPKALAPTRSPPQRASSAQGNFTSVAYGGMGTSLQRHSGNVGAVAISNRLARAASSTVAAISPVGERQRDPPAIQAKLTISHPDDPFEKEAESVADKVMRMPEPESLSGTRPPDYTNKPVLSVQRVCADCDEGLSKGSDVASSLAIGSIGQIRRIESSAEAPQVTPAVVANVQAMQGSGSPLPAATRAFFEPRFGADFSQVRVHTSVRAEEVATSISANAFTVGRNIAFAGGQYAPDSPKGQRLLAHELTHVVQQDGGRLQRASICLMPEEPAASSKSAEEIIDSHTTIGFLDEKGLGVDLAGRLPTHVALAHDVLHRLPNRDRDDVSYEIVGALGAKLSTVDEGLRMAFVGELIGGMVTDDEEGAVANVWISFEPGLPKVAERNRELWRKSLWESDQLCDYVKPYANSFGGDVIGVAKAYLEENRRVLNSEALRYGFDLDDKKNVDPTNPDYLNQVRELVPQIVSLQKQMDELKELRVGYDTQTIFASVMDEAGHEIETPVRFDPDRRPTSGPKGTEQPSWPTWAETNTQYQRVNAVISAFASQYPSVYILMQQGRLDALEQAEDASKARDVVFDAMEKTQEKIDESIQKVDGGGISYYDLRLIQAQLFSGDVQAGYVLRHPWNEPFFQDIGNDDIKGHESREFWVDLGLSLVAAAALIAAPFTGGASAAFLVGFGIGIGGGQAGMSWDKYLKLSTLSDANVTEELALVAKGEVTAALVEAIVNTVSVFLDVFGARGAMTGAKQAVKVAEAQLAKTAAEEANKKALRGAMKESAMLLGGSAFAIGMHELGEEDDPVPDLTASAAEWEISLGPEELDAESSDSDGPHVSRVFIFRVPGPGGAAGAAAGGTPSVASGIVTGADFELHIEKALLQGKVGNMPQMSFVLPGQYNPQGWGIDRIGIVFDERTGTVRVFHLEMKWVRPGSTFTPKLGTPSAGTQTGGPWTRKAVDGLLNSRHPVAKNARRRLKRFLQKINPGKTVDDAFMSAFLLEKVTKAPVRVVVPHWADFSKLYKQVAALARLRKIKLTKVLGKK